MGTERPPRRWRVPVPVLVVGTTVGAVAAVALVYAASGPSPSRRGKELFTGAVSLRARMTGHETDLPPEVVRCINCHRLPSDTPAPSSSKLPEPSSSLRGSESAPIEALAPDLSSQRLTQAVPRRGGPASRYDAQSFCSVLRFGVDPAHVMIPQTMPRYTLTEQECQELWAYVTAS